MFERLTYSTNRRSSPQVKLASLGLSVLVHLSLMFAAWIISPFSGPVSAAPPPIRITYFERPITLVTQGSQARPLQDPQGGEAKPPLEAPAAPAGGALPQRPVTVEGGSQAPRAPSSALVKEEAAPEQAVSAPEEAALPEEAEARERGPSAPVSVGSEPPSGSVKTAQAPSRGDQGQPDTGAPAPEARAVPQQIQGQPPTQEEPAPPQRIASVKPAKQPQGGSPAGEGAPQPLAPGQSPGDGDLKAPSGEDRGAQGLQAPAPQARVPDGPVRIDGSMPLPRVKREANLTYPPMAMSQRLVGTVLVELTVNEKGRVTDAEIVSSPSPLFNREAQRAAMRMRFEPYQLRGEPVSFILRVPFKFDPKR